MAEKFEIETTQLEKVSVHQVGNQTNNEDLIISKDLLDLSDGKLKDLLMMPEIWEYLLKCHVLIMFMMFQLLIYTIL